MARTKKLDVERILAQEPERTARWQTLVKTDARRTVRALTIVGFDNETIDGDTMWDMPHIIMHLKNEAQNPKSEVWTRLVNAGVCDALYVYVTIYARCSLTPLRCFANNREDVSAFSTPTALHSSKTAILFHKQRPRRRLSRYATSVFYDAPFVDERSDSICILHGSYPSK